MLGALLAETNITDYPLGNSSLMNHPDSTSCSFDGDITQKTNVQLAQGRELQVQNGIDSYLECLIVGVERADLGLVAHVDIPQCLLQPGDQCQGLRHRALWSRIWSKAGYSDPVDGGHAERKSTRLNSSHLGI